jgi:glyoxylase-like metal-dependent hydrolase (beta-lactamase superfamily II)/rhodanese-related sulfurtransferase
MSQCLESARGSENDYIKCNDSGYLGDYNLTFNPYLRRGSDKLEIDAHKLKEKMDKGEDVFILDVRTPEEYEAWRLSYDKHAKTPLIPIDRLFGAQKSIAEQVPKDKEIITLCAHGNRSMMAAQLLSQMGYNVKSVRGGMAAWNQVYDIATVADAPESHVRIWQLRRISKGCLSYVIAAGREAAVIDSTCDLDSSVIKLAQENDLKITNVIDTHMHADHVSGLVSLARKTGAKAYVGAAEGYDISNGSVDPVMVNDSQRISLGSNVFLTAIHTPGHTEGSTSYVLETSSGSERKTYLFSGDTLFVNAVGRPDLRDKASEYAATLHDTYHNKLLKLPDNTLVLPAHFDTGSITVKHGELIADTIGSVRKNVKLLSMPREEFVQFMSTSVSPRPANYKMIVQINHQLAPCEEINMGDLEAGPNSCAIRM